MLKNIIKITPNAIKKLSELKKTHNCNALKFYIKGGGCNGFNYMLEPTNDKPDKLDEIFKENDVELHICNESLLHILGTEIDWCEDIMGSAFKFDNPNAKSSCGCGTSFGV